jgi:DNA-binding NtrC family response regulator
MEPILNYPKEKNRTKAVIPIFVVDDDLTYVCAIGFHLKKNPKYKVYCYSTGEECIKNIRLNPSIIILDYFLNSGKADAIDGLEVLKQIKIKKPKAKVIMLSGQKTLDVATDSLKLGAYTYVIKDINAIPSVIKTVNTLCGGKELQKA